MTDFITRLNSSVQFAREKMRSKYDWAVVFGSGLTPQNLQPVSEIPYSSIPGFPVSTVRGHEGTLKSLNVEGKRVALFCGRVHYYEGHSQTEAAYPVFFAKALGCGRIILTNAAGSLRPSMKPGKVVWIRSHINISGLSPLRGLDISSIYKTFNMNEKPTPFIPLNDAYSMRREMKRAASRLRLKVSEGVYAYHPGPAYETPIEASLYAKLGAHIAGMSTVPEVIIARLLKMEVAAFSVVTNYSGRDSSHEEVLKNTEGVKGRLWALVQEMIREG